jgi:hypothetical protein
MPGIKEGRGVSVYEGKTKVVFAMVFDHAVRKWFGKRVVTERRTEQSSK